MITDVRDGMAAAESIETRYVRLVEQHGAAMRRLAFSYERDPSRREDLVQDINLALWLALPGFRTECSERTFVFRIAHNRGISHAIRARRRATDPLDEVEAEPDARDDPEKAAAGRQQQERLRRAVVRLPLGLRQVIVLTLEGLPQRDIADVLGISENNVAVRMTRARHTLRRLLQPTVDSK